MTTFNLPPVVAALVRARNRLRKHYGRSGLRFTFDGNLVGDIGEAVAAELFGVELRPPGCAGIDGYVNGRSVQVKATGTGRGPAFRCIDTRADHLLFLSFDFEGLKGTIEYNGPEKYLLNCLPPSWPGQLTLPMRSVRLVDLAVHEDERIRRIDG